MIPVYSDVKTITGLHTAGICSIMITPREWLSADPVIDFATGKVLNAVTLQAQKFWMVLQLTPRSYDYSEIPKPSKSGDFYQVNLSGQLNTFNFSLQHKLETIRYSEMVAVVTDRNKRRKIIGNTSAAMRLTVTHTHKNAPSSEEKLQIELSCEVEGLPPFYNPDNVPDALGNYLINSDGNYLLVD